MYNLLWELPQYSLLSVVNNLEKSSITDDPLLSMLLFYMVALYAVNHITHGMAKQLWITTIFFFQFLVLRVGYYLFIHFHCIKYTLIMTLVKVVECDCMHLASIHVSMLYDYMTMMLGAQRYRFQWDWTKIVD